MSLLLQAIGINKWIAYGALALTLIATLAGVVWKIRSDGAQAEKAKQLTATLSRIQKEAIERAKIEAIATATARTRLRERWSAR